MQCWCWLSQLLKLSWKFFFQPMLWQTNRIFHSVIEEIFSENLRGWNVLAHTVYCWVYDFTCGLSASESKDQHWPLRCCLLVPMFTHFSRTPTCDGRADRQTDRAMAYTAQSIARVVKKMLCIFSMCCKTKWVIYYIAAVNMFFL